MKSGGPVGHGLTGARLLKSGLQGCKLTEETVARGAPGKDWCLTLEKSTEFQNVGRLL